MNIYSIYVLQLTAVAKTSNVRPHRVDICENLVNIFRPLACIAARLKVNFITNFHYLVVLRFVGWQRGCVF